MATFGQWVEGARLRTLPLAFAPVLAGAGAAIGALGGVSDLIIGSPLQADSPTINYLHVIVCVVLALIVALALQIGSNFANDYSDGVRGTDDVRVGPTRLTASGLVPPQRVKRAAMLSFATAGVAGLALTLVAQAWWFIPVGVLAVLAAWFYTGGSHPYGYYALGEVFVFIFFGLVATVGTGYAIAGTMTLSMWAAAVGVGLFACAVLMVNNVRDIPTDTQAGKTTLAVVLGDRGARVTYAVMVLVPYALLLISVLAGHIAALIAVISCALVIAPLRTVLNGRTGLDLIPCIKSTGFTALAYGALVGLGLAL